MILCIETATTLCSVALCNSSGIIGLKENAEGRSHASQLTILIQELLEEYNTKINDIEAVAVSKGPGSYTGLRIGVSVAKGIAYASSKPLIGIETTMSMYRGVIHQSVKKYCFSDTDLFCPVLDARRMEIYYSVFSFTGNKVKETCAEIVDASSFSGYPGSSVIYIFGEGASKCKAIIKQKNVVFDEEYRISAGSMHIPSYESLLKSAFEDTAYFEPLYLKDFLTTKPVKNILRK